MASKRARCYFCGKFIAVTQWMTNWKVIQVPGVADPEPYEIIWCNDCTEHARAFGGDSQTAPPDTGAMSNG